MQIERNTVLSLANGLDYIVLASIDYNGSKYHYLVEVTKDGEDLKDLAIVMKEVQNGDRLALDTLKDDSEIKIITKMLLLDLMEHNPVESEQL